MNDREDLIHIRMLIKAREQEGFAGSTKAEVATGQEIAAKSWHLISEDRYRGI